MVQSIISTDGQMHCGPPDCSCTETELLPWFYKYDIFHDKTDDMLQKYATEISK